MFRVVFVFLLSFSPMLLASVEFVPLQERAEGQSLTGASLQNDSLYSNPASGAFQNVYSLDGTYLLSKGFAVSVLDTKTSAVGGALGYFRLPIQGTEQTTQGVKVSLCNKYSENVAVGISGKMIWSPNVLETGKDRTVERLTDMDIGVLSHFGVLEVGTTLKNAIFGDKKVLDTYREFALGGRINWNQLLFFSATAISKLSEIKPYQYGFGAEFITPYYFSIKGGYRFLTEGANPSFWSAGASFISPKFNVHYAVEFPNQAEATTEHILGITVFL